MAEGNDRVLVSEEAFVAATSKFEICDLQLQNAYLKMADTVDSLESSWLGAASKAFQDKFEALKENLKSSEKIMSDTKEELKTFVSGYAQVENELDALLQKMEDTTDPFAAG